MTEQEIQQNNILIEKFMGRTGLNGMCYHSSWDWLMPVVQKIVNADMDTFDSYALWVSDSLRTADISQVYYSVVQYIINQPTKPVNQD